VTEKLGGLIVNRWGQMADRLPRPSRSWARGRVCAEEDCDTVLSIYNPDVYCAAHASFAYLSGGRTYSVPRRAA
jgi:hypothetical protein